MKTKFLKKIKQLKICDMENLETHKELRQRVIESFSKFNKKINESEKILSLDLGQCSIALEWLEDLNIYHIFISENKFLKINSNFKQLLQQNIDTLVKSWNPFQEYEDNPVELNTSAWIEYLRR